MDSVMGLRQKAGVATPPITYVPIRPHIIRRSNGTGGLSIAVLNRIIATTNHYYLITGSGIQFYFAGTSPEYIDNDTIFAGNISESAVDGHDATNALNQYYVNAFPQAGLGGYAYYPANTIQSTRSFILTAGNETEDDLGNRLIPHELGHTFNLAHTFGNTNTGTTTELVTRGAGANCTTAGDFLCDTPADPYQLPNATTAYVNGCQTYTGTATDPNGALYTPSVTNIMSYYFPCTHDFTPNQYSRIQGGLALRQSHTAYSLDYPPDPVSAPTSLTASLSLRGSVQLTWTDNATNEMGYFVERAAAATGPFMAIGAVEPDSALFIDVTVESNTTYYYRIRPSNTTLGSLSPVLPVLTRMVYCIPTYIAGCTDSDGLSSLVINSDTVSRQTDCSGPKGYSEFWVPTHQLRVGQPISFTAVLLSASYNEGLTIWADLNRDGVYDASERLFQSASVVSGSISGTVSIPVSVTAGTLPFRYVVTYNQVPDAPCGNYRYGETEDYLLTVLPQAGSTLYTVKDGAWNDPAVWLCNCVPTAVDLVQVKHLISLPSGYVAHALAISLEASKKLSYGAGAKVRLGF